MKKIAAIHDLSGVGRCSLTAAIPILSALKTQCCPFPTAILSSQTGYPKYSFLDFTDHMREYSNVWSELNINFDYIYSGFLGSKDQVDIVIDFIKKNNNSFVIVDPVMGDNGNMYSIFDNEMCKKIKNLVKISNLTTPNITEACLLTNRSISDIGDLTKKDIINMAKEISELGPENVIITGVVQDGYILNIGYDKISDNCFITSFEYNNLSYSGTGDIFTSIICGLIANGHDLEFAINKSSYFVHKVVNYTSKFDTDRNDGIMFEYFLNELTRL